MTGTVIACRHPQCMPGSVQCAEREKQLLLEERERFDKGIPPAREQRNDQSMQQFADVLYNAALMDTPSIDVPATLIVTAEIWLKMLADAQQQLDNVRGIATLMHGIRRTDLIDQAVAGWHYSNPGLSQALNLTNQT